MPLSMLTLNKQNNNYFLLFLNYQFVHSDQRWTGGGEFFYKQLNF